MHKQAAALLAILQGPLAPTFRVRVHGNDLELRLKNRTPEHLTALHEAFAPLGKPRTGQKGKLVFEKRSFKVIIVPEISPEHLPPDVRIRLLKSGLSGVRTQFRRED
ncbi:MAG: hypothetical protein V1722_01480 [Candidatus Micrarchaeota archaeon]